jgi:hypothetical protein
MRSKITSLDDDSLSIPPKAAEAEGDYDYEKRGVIYIVVWSHFQAWVLAR